MFLVKFCDIKIAKSKENVGNEWQGHQLVSRADKIAKIGKRELREEKIQQILMLKEAVMPDFVGNGGKEEIKANEYVYFYHRKFGENLQVLQRL